MNNSFFNARFYTIMFFSFLSALFGCGDGPPGLFSSFGYHIGAQKVWYKYSTGMAYNVDEVTGADPKTFVIRQLKSKALGTTSEYGIDQNHVYWGSKLIEGADPATIEYLSGCYSQDKNAVYYMSDRLTDDLPHIEVVSQDFIKDSRHVYFGGRSFSDDPAHFTRVGEIESKYFRDSYMCWYGIYELKGADPATLHYLGPGTAADATHIYQEMNEVEGADLKTYQILADGYSKDAHNVYQNSIQMEGARPATFRVLGSNYSLDDQHCFYFNTPIKDADPATFQLIDPFYSKDARRVFIGGALIEGADPTTFRVLNGSAGCSCDAHHAYSMEKRIEGSDPSRFPAGPCKTCNESGVNF
jgi:hypothetical protein